MTVERWPGFVVAGIAMVWRPCRLPNQNCIAGGAPLSEVALLSSRTRFALKHAVLRRPGPEALRPGRLPWSRRLQVAHLQHPNAELR